MLQKLMLMQTTPCQEWVIQIQRNEMQFLAAMVQAPSLQTKMWRLHVVKQLKIISGAEYYVVFSQDKMQTTDCINNQTRYKMQTAD